MILTIDHRSAVPPFAQLRDQLAALITAGVLDPGARLPTVRQLAGDLGLAGGTVVRAYRELESEGLIVTRGRHGTTVADRAGPAPEPAVHRAARRFVTEARKHGVAIDDALDAVRAAYLSGET